jgi:hypothetical protein
MVGKTNVQNWYKIMKKYCKKQVIEIPNKYIKNISKVQK